MDKSESGTEAVVKIFTKLGIKLWMPPAKKKKRNYVLSEIIKKSSFNRTQYIMIIKNWKLFYEEVKAVKPNRANNDVRYIPN